MRDSSSLRVGAAKQCCQQGWSSTPSSISLTQNQHCTKLHISESLEKGKNEFFHHLSPLHQHKGEGRTTGVLRIQRTASLQWFGLNSHKVPAVCSNMGWSPLTIKLRFYSRCCNRNWLQFSCRVSQVAKGAVGKRCDHNSHTQTQQDLGTLQDPTSPLAGPQDPTTPVTAPQDPTTLLAAPQDPTTPQAALFNASPSHCHAPDGKLVGFRMSSPGKQQEMSESTTAKPTAGVHLGILGAATGRWRCETLFSHLHCPISLQKSKLLVLSQVSDKKQDLPCPS